jgi:hypothetical protein
MLAVEQLKIEWMQEYSPGMEKYVLEQGKESNVTLAFLEDEAALLVKRDWAQKAILGSRYFEVYR